MMVAWSCDLSTVGNGVIRRNCFSSDSLVCVDTVVLPFSPLPAGKGENGSTTVSTQTNESLLKQFRLMTPLPTVLRSQLHATIIE